MQNSKGFTLIELIIAISILGMLMFTGSYVYSTMSSRWDKELGEFNANFSEARSIILIQDLLAGVMPFVVRDDRQNKQPPAMFFVGKEDSILAISRAGIVEQALPEIFRLTAIKNDNDKFDLVYQSLSTKDIVLTSTMQNVDFNHSFILLRDLDGVIFNYLGWESFAIKNLSTEDMADPEVKWYTDYSGLDRLLNPERIELSIQKGSKNLQFEVQLDAASQILIEQFYSDHSDI